MVVSRRRFGHARFVKPGPISASIERFNRSGSGLRYGDSSHLIKTEATTLEEAVDALRARTKTKVPRGGKRPQPEFKPDVAWSKDEVVKWLKAGKLQPREAARLAKVKQRVVRQWLYDAGIWDPRFEGDNHRRPHQPPHYCVDPKTHRTLWGIWIEGNGRSGWLTRYDTLWKPHPTLGRLVFKTPKTAQSWLKRSRANHSNVASWWTFEVRRHDDPKTS